MLLSCWILSEPVSTAALLEHSSFCYTKALTESVWDLSTALFLKNYTLPHLCPSPFSEDSAFIYLFIFESKLFLLDNFNLYESFFSSSYKVSSREAAIRSSICPL